IKLQNEKGQILVLLAVGLVGLLAFVALAIDGGMIYFDRRSAQNAADAAALAGAYVLARDPLAQGLPTVIADAAKNRAESNNYKDLTNGTTIVPVYPFDPGSRTVGGDPSSANYVYVSITSTVKTSFAHLFGFGTVKNTVEAVAHVTPTKRDNPFAGSAMVALAPTGCGDANGGGGGIYISGNSFSNLVGGGMFVNSNSNCALNGKSGSFFVYTPTLVDVGGVGGGISPSQLVVQPGPDLRNQGEAKALSYPPKNGLDSLPTSVCATLAELSMPDVNQTSSDDTTWKYLYHLSAGYYNEILPNGDIWLGPGIHCFDNQLKGQQYESIISLNSTQHLGGEGV
ncbi:MAG: pilus assembly protein TadG-related protein, partial [Saprospiraceae bacterium]|nr:pilus assembly protein TadG-related protein [Saprospiraceae bacterium]